MKEDLTTRIDAQLAELRSVMQTDLPEFNETVRTYAVPAVIVDMPAADAPVVGSGGR